MTADKNQPLENQPVSPHQRVLKVAPQVIYGRPDPDLMRIHADDVQGTLPNGESPEEHGGELVGYSPVPVPNRKPDTGRRVVEALAYLALAIAANPFAYILAGPILGEETLESLFVASLGFLILSIGILPLVLFIFSLWALINFLGVMVQLIWRRKAEEKLTFRLVYECAPPSEANQESDASPQQDDDIDQPVMDPGPLPTSSQKSGAWSLFFAVSVLNPYIAAGLLSVTALFGAGPLIASLFLMANTVSEGLMGIPGIIWCMAWILSLVRLNESDEA
ncbi:type VI secretion protein [uncultured Rothia sp.]|uniref:type VI secretion protein n=1 Tax=uncultured Rothia sp. TaxID=316088 RepID=UPI002630E204|nr:type VI secretion protein [uncultured Rothia sp.]